MNFTLRVFLLHVLLFAIAFSIVFIYGQSIYSHFVVSALYSVAMAVTSGRYESLRNGIIGAVIGWAVSLILMVGVELEGYLTYTGNAPYFDGDGPVAGLIYLPLFAFVYLLLPLGAMGGFIGYFTFVMRVKFCSGGQEVIDSVDI